MASTGGKKKGKKQAKTLSLNEFLADDAKTGGGGGGGAPAFVSRNWADEMENEDLEEIDFGGAPKVNRVVLPTAPRAARGADVDMDRVPTNPPFTAFLGNLPYDTTDEEIEQFFQPLEVTNIRIPTGRMKGFGYAEFKDRADLIEALGLNDEKLRNRQIRIDLADNQPGGEGRDRERGGMGGEEGPDRTLGDWRRRDDKPAFDDRDGDRGGFSRDRDRGFGDRDRDDRGGDRGYGRDRYGDRDRGFGGDRDRDRGYGGDRDRGYGGDRGFGGGFRDRDSRGGGGGYGRDRYDDRDGGRRSFGSGYSNDRDGDRYGGGRDRYGDRDRFGDRDRYDRGPDRGSERDDAPRERPRLNLQPRTRPVEENGPDTRDSRDTRDTRDTRDSRDQRDSRDNRPPPPPASSQREDERPDRSDGDREQDGPRERPRLNLQPRSKPAEEAGPPGDKASRPSIFGSAKPVDTATRERQIEERLRRQHDQEREKYESDKENRQRLSSSTSQEGPIRRRQDSDHSQDGSERTTRRERKSSSSSGKGIRTVAPPPGVGSARVRKDSQLSDSGEVFDEGSTKPAKPPTPQKDEPAPKLVPAPPPKENIWEKRKTENQQKSGPPQGSTPPKPSPATQSQARSPPSQQAPPQNKSPSSQSNQPPKREQAQPPSQPQGSKPNQASVPAAAPKENAWNKGKPATLVPAEPPKENVWAKRKQEQEQKKPAAPQESGSHSQENSIDKPSQSDKSTAPNSDSSEPPVDTGRSEKSTAEKGTVTDTHIEEKGYNGSESVSDSPARSERPREEARTRPFGRGKSVVVSAKTDGEDFQGSLGQPRRGGYSRGRGGERGRGRGAERGRGQPGSRARGDRTKPIPKSVDDMPKYEEKSNKDWSDTNKFSMLGDEDGGEQEDSDGGEWQTV